MNLRSVIIVLAASVVCAACESGVGSGSVSLKNAADSASYAIGYVVASNNKMQIDASPGKEQLDLDIIIKAFAESLKTGESKMDQNTAQGAIANFFDAIANKAGEGNMKEGAEFLEKNKAKEGIVTLESGLQYEILTAGNGPKPTSDQIVEVHYHGTLIDGTVFDSSVDRGEPVTFPVMEVISGWTEALQLMPVGSKWKLYIPGELAYGLQSPSPAIGPNQLLIFEVELLGIVDEDHFGHQH